MSSPSKQASSKALTSSRSPSPTSAPALATTSASRPTTPTARATTPTTRASTSTARATTSTAAAVVNYPALYMVFWDSVQQFSNADAGKYHLGFVYVDSAPSDKGGSDATYLHIVYEDSTETESRKKWRFRPDQGRRRRSGKMRAACYLGSVNVDLAGLTHQLDTGIELKQDQTDYRCRHWTLDSLELLIKYEYIEAPPLTPNELYSRLLATLEKALAKNPQAFVTINQKGEVMRKSGLFD